MAECCLSAERILDEWMGDFTSIHIQSTSTHLFWSFYQTFRGVPSSFLPSFFRSFTTQIYIPPSSNGFPPPLLQPFNIPSPSLGSSIIAKTYKCKRKEEGGEKKDSSVLNCLRKWKRKVFPWRNLWMWGYSTADIFIHSLRDCLKFLCQRSWICSSLSFTIKMLPSSSFFLTLPSIPPHPLPLPHPPQGRVEQKGSAKFAFGALFSCGRSIGAGLTPQSPYPLLCGLGSRSKKRKIKGVNMKYE